MLTVQASTAMAKMAACPAANDTFPVFGIAALLTTFGTSLMPSAALHAPRSKRPVTHELLPSQTALLQSVRGAGGDRDLLGRLAAGTEFNPDMSSPVSGESCLMTALRRGDDSVSRFLLEYGADPRKHGTALERPGDYCTDPGLVALHRFAVCRAVLFPREGGNPGDLSPLRRVAQTASPDEIWQTVRGRLEALSPRLLPVQLPEALAERSDLLKPWQEMACKARDSELLRALLLLDPVMPNPDYLDHYRQCAVELKDVALQDWLKQVVYCKGGEAQLNLNMKAVFTGSKDPIVCRHISTAVALHGKPLIKQLDSLEAIAKLIPPAMDHTYSSLFYTSRRGCLFRNDGFAKVVRDIVQNMEAEGRTRDVWCLLSENHVMTLFVDKKNGYHVIRFYDPNKTTLYQCLRVFDLVDLPNSLNVFLDEAFIEAYYPAASQTGVPAMTLALQVRQEPAWTVRRRMRWPDIHHHSAHALLLLLGCGYALENKDGRWDRVDWRAFSQLLGAKVLNLINGNRNYDWLFLNLQMTPWLLKKLDIDAFLMMAKSSDMGMLEYALLHDQKEVVSGILGLLKKCSAKQLAACNWSALRALRSRLSPDSGQEDIAAILDKVLGIGKAYEARQKPARLAASDVVAAFLRRCGALPSGS